MKVVPRFLLGLAVSIVLAAGTPAQSRRQKPASPSKSSQPALSDQASEARTNLIAATTNYRESLETVLELQKRNEATAEQNLTRQKEMFAAGIVSRLEVEKSEQALFDLRARSAEVYKQIEGADHLIMEVTAEEQLAKTKKSQTSPMTSQQRGLVLVRYAGTSPWSLNNYPSLDQFFRNQFARSLPVSAFGQTDVHDRMGFAHHGAIDVALHPDSVEGRALMAHLQSLGIPFLAFRQAVAGSATGAHIHIGPPSHRVATP
jgi:Outer membrane efflux protein